MLSIALENQEEFRSGENILRQNLDLAIDISLADQHEGALRLRTCLVKLYSTFLGMSANVKEVLQESLGVYEQTESQDNHIEHVWQAIMRREISFGIDNRSHTLLNKLEAAIGRYMQPTPWTDLLRYTLAGY